MKKSPMDDEPRYTISIKFSEWTCPVVYKNKTLSEVAHIFEKWCISWILIPSENKLTDDIWNWTAKVRSDNGLSWPEYQEIILDELRTM